MSIKDRLPSVILADNPYGILFFGPEGSRDVPDSLMDYTLATAGGYVEQHCNNGNTHLVCPGKHEETIGQNIDSKQKESIAKSIVAKNGDICIVAENGSIKLKARNIYIEAEGPSNQGSVSIAANGPTVIATSDNLVLAGGKVCIRGQAGVDIASANMIKMLGSISYGSPLSSLTSIFLPGPLADLINGVFQSCK